ncbi:Phospholipase C precursor [Thermincola ferriacetica]|uniref:Phospholipase C n=1 Tax=Thermincola ferriacetica TaxID=281456 RepID=A0A0L6W4C9_9FIRM|nr:zinc dependent phospholipase C family protein [Thermincola ferriacetica]KNZ70395.1 Phospholipase C precursor [Thermincola ferriacetica]
MEATTSDPPSILDWTPYQVSESTHRWIAIRAVEKLKKDGLTKWYNTAQKYSYWLYKGVDDADKGQGAYTGHFYSPKTKKNYVGGTDTALKRMKNFFEKAVGLFNKNKHYAFYNLGFSLHYLQDLGNPAHASNNIAPITAHSEFEEDADWYKNNFEKELSIAKTKIYYGLKNLEDFGHSVAVQSSRYAYVLDDRTDVAQHSLNPEWWHKVIRITLKQSQVDSAKLLAYFFAKQKIAPK